MAKLVTTTYAQALFQLAIEEEKVDELFMQVSELIAILDENPSLAKIMRHPGIDKNEKIDAIDNIFSGRISGEVCGLLHQVVLNNRYEEIDGILASFVSMVKEYKKIGVAYVQTPADLTDAQKSRIEQRLLETTDYVKMEMHYSVDRSLIGGMKIRIGDRVVDSSISTKLNELAKNLRRIQLNTI
jgi:F-type H+-transporting ATPase subunit delta